MHSILPGGGTLVLGALEFKIGTLAKGRLQFERRGPAAGPRQIVGRVRFENGNSVAVSGIMQAEKNGPAVIDALRIGPAADASDHEFFEIAAAPPPRRTLGMKGCPAANGAAGDPTDGPLDGIESVRR